MLILTKASVVLLLFGCFYVLSLEALYAVFRRSGIRSRLSYKRTNRLAAAAARYLKGFGVLTRHLTDVLESTGYKSAAINGFYTLSGCLLVIGMLMGSLLFQSFKGVGVMCLLLGGMPYMTLRMRLVTLRMKTRLEFLPAVEVFYQQYVLSPHKNIRIVLRSSLEGNHLLYPLRTVFAQLERNLSAQHDVEDGLRIFSYSLGHLWADYFVNIIRFGLMEGIDVSESLKELISDMRKAQRADQQDRNRLLEIRLANFTPLLFLAVFLVINFKMNPAGSYNYYIMDPIGRDLLLDALLFIFASFIMGVYLSVKRM